MKIFECHINLNSLFICISITTLILMSCSDNSNGSTNVQSKNNSKAQTQTPLKIDYPTGTLLPESILKSKVPTLFNVGELTENVYGILLGPPLAKNKHYDYEPIGVYRMIKDSTELSFVLCKSDQLKDDLVDNSSYNSWSINEIHYKNLIAAWFKTNCELNNCSKMEWANDLKALRILENVE